MRILYAEDEIGMSQAVADVLTYRKYAVDVVDNGVDALTYATAQHYDLMILDIMLPGLDGITVVRELRAAGVAAPVLLLTARSETEDRVRGLDAGADDYLPKPFAMSELLARVRALLRRRETFTPDRLCVGDLVLDQKSVMLCCGERSVPLSRLEFRLMELFMRHPGMVLSTSLLLEQAWDGVSDAEVGAVWVYISYLRKKLHALDAHVVIRSKRGIGYCLEVSA